MQLQPTLHLTNVVIMPLLCVSWLPNHAISTHHPLMASLEAPITSRSLTLTDTTSPSILKNNLLHLSTKAYNQVIYQNQPFLWVSLLQFVPFQCCCKHSPVSDELP